MQITIPAIVNRVLDYYCMRVNLRGGAALFRTRTRGELRLTHRGRDVTLAWWVHRSRAQGPALFLDLRDRYGVTQLVADPAAKPEARAVLEEARSEAADALSMARQKGGRWRIQKCPQGLHTPAHLPCLTGQWSGRAEGRLRSALA
jgi:hypothetical protein